MTYMAATQKRAFIRKHRLDKTDITIARAMWMEGSDTKQISVALRSSEAVVYNNLDKVKGRI